MAINQLLLKAYATAIMTGARIFAVLSQEYVQPVKEYLAVNRPQSDIKIALDSGYITKEEYDEIMALKATLGVTDVEEQI